MTRTEAEQVCLLVKSALDYPGFNDQLKSRQEGMADLQGKVMRMASPDLQPVKASVPEMLVAVPPIPGVRVLTAPQPEKSQTPVSHLGALGVDRVTGRGVIDPRTGQPHTGDRPPLGADERADNTVLPNLRGERTGDPIPGDQIPGDPAPGYRPAAAGTLHVEHDDDPRALARDEQPLQNRIEREADQMDEQPLSPREQQSVEEVRRADDARRSNDREFQEKETVRRPRQR